MVAPTGPYPPIADYGLIGDSTSCALVSKAGSIDWCCLPRFDSPSVFGRLLDWERGGHFQIWVEGTRDVRRRYLPETMVLETTFRSDPRHPIHGIALELLCLDIGPREH